MITYREMTEADKPLLADMIWKMWAGDDIKAKPEVAIHYGYMVLYYELVHSSKAFVADDNGKAVGLLILDIKDGHPIHGDYLMKMLEHTIELCKDPDGNKNQKDWNDLEKEYKGAEHLLEGKNNGAEVALLIMDADHRRQGVGSGIFRHMSRYLHEQGVERFYLHTDQCSNHEFYPEKRKMTELNRRQSKVAIGGLNDIELYIYYDDVINQINL